MAWNVRWRYVFASLNDTQYVVEIYDEDYAGSVVQLTGAANPFETNEDNDEEFFNAVRSQTGYLRIADDGDSGFDWRDLLPDERQGRTGNAYTGRPVVLRKTGTDEVVWRGFIQRQQPENVLYTTPAEREYAVYDMLGVGEFLYFDTGYDSGSDYINFAEVLLRVIDSLPEPARPGYVYVQDYERAREVLLSKVNPQLFYAVDDAQSDRLKDAPALYTCSEVLEEMGKFWGRTFRTHGGDLYAVQDYTPTTDSADTGHRSFVRLSLSDLQEMSGGADVGTPVSALTAVEIDGGDTASVDNEIHTTETYQNATVTASAGSHTTLVKLFPDYVRQRIADTSYTKFGNKDSKIVVSSSSISEYDASGHHYRTTRAAALGNVFGFPNEQNKLYVVEGRDEYDYVAGPFLAAYGGGVGPVIETLWPMCYSDCALSMTATFFNRDGTVSDTRGDVEEWGQVGNREIWMSICFVAANGRTYYYTNEDTGNSSWIARWEQTSQERLIGAFIGGGNKYFYFQSGRAGVNLVARKYITFDGLPSQVGRVVIRLHGGSEEIGVGDMEVEVVRLGKKSMSPSSENEYNFYTENWPRSFAIVPYNRQRHVRDEWSIDTIFASDDNNQFGFGTLLRSTGEPLVKMLMADGGEYHPEQWVVKMVREYYRTKRMVVAADLLDYMPHVSGVSPRSRLVFGGVTFYPVSISRRWIDNVVRVVGMQVSGGRLTLYHVTAVAGTGVLSASGGTALAGQSVTVTCVVADLYVFNHWEDGDGHVVSYSQTYTIQSVTSDMTLTAVASADTTDYTVVVRRPAGVASVSGGGVYRVGTSVTVGCVLDTDYEFLGWLSGGIGGSMISSSETFTLNVRDNIVLYPHVQYNGSGERESRLFFAVRESVWGYIKDDSDEVFMNGDETVLIEGEVRQYTGVPAEGYEFVRWLLNGVVHSTSNPLTFAEDDETNNSVLTAVFKEVVPVTQWRLTVRCNMVRSYASLKVKIGDGAEQQYSFPTALTAYEFILPVGETVTLTAINDPYYVQTFKWWQDNDVPGQSSYPTSNPYTVTMDEEKDLTMVFE